MAYKGKYSSADASSLLSLANNALAELDSYNISSLSGSIASCQFKGKLNIENALKEIQSGGLSGGIVNLEIKLRNLQDAANSISKYQEYEKEIQRLRDDENNGTWENSGKKNALGKIIWYWKRNNNQLKINYYTNLLDDLEEDIDKKLS